MTEVLLELDSVGKTFGGLRALHDVSLDVRTGEVVGIMGANGAGKTTLFSLIGGHATPSAGDIILNGRSIVGLSPDRICRRGIARTFQIVRPFRGLSVRDNVTIASRFGAKARDVATASRTAVELLASVGLADRSDDLAEALTLSGQKRLEVARAVATGARIVLLDEVMAGLTPTEVGYMLAILGQLREQYGLTILMIEHVMRALMRISDRILVLHHGECITVGSPAEVVDDERVRACYLGDRA
jgi:branched-chain amino acid transport system ATP-binding protein